MISPHSTIFKEKKRQKMSNYKLAVKAGISAQIIYNYQKKPDYKITLDSAMKLCDALGIKLVVEEGETKVSKSKG